MTDNMQVKIYRTISLQLNLGDQNLFAIHVRTREKITERIDDAAPAATHNSIRIVSKYRAVISGKVAPQVELVARQHKASALNRDVAHGSEIQESRESAVGAQ